MSVRKMVKHERSGFGVMCAESGVWWLIAGGVLMVCRIG